jgi:hypothetical protein
LDARGRRALIDKQQDCLLFYNGQDNSGAVGILDLSGFKTCKDYPAGSFRLTSRRERLFGRLRPGSERRRSGRGSAHYAWTNIVGVKGGFLCVDSTTGDGVVARWNEVNQDLETVKTYGAGAFTQGWTHILPYTDAGGFAGAGGG